MKAVTSSTLHCEGAGLNVVVGVEVVTAGADALLALRAARRSILAVMATAGSSSPPSSSSSSLPPPPTISSSSSSSSAAAAFSFPSFSRWPALHRSRGWKETKRVRNVKARKRPAWYQQFRGCWGDSVGPCSTNAASFKPHTPPQSSQTGYLYMTPQSPALTPAENTWDVVER